MESKIDKNIRDKLAKKYNCYVLITCDSSAENGKMNIEMSYEGDPVLASCMLNGAQGYLEEQEPEFE